MQESLYQTTKHKYSSVIQYYCKTLMQYPCYFTYEVCICVKCNVPEVILHLSALILVPLVQKPQDALRKRLSTLILRKLHRRRGKVNNRQTTQRIRFAQIKLSSSVCKTFEHKLITSLSNAAARLWNQLEWCWMKLWPKNMSTYWNELYNPRLTIL